jgi:hypothetical protein
MSVQAIFVSNLQLYIYLYIGLSLTLSVVERRHGPAFVLCGARLSNSVPPLLVDRLPRLHPGGQRRTGRRRRQQRG